MSPNFLLITNNMPSLDSSLVVSMKTHNTIGTIKMKKTGCKKLIIQKILNNTLKMCLVSSDELSVPAHTA